MCTWYIYLRIVNFLLLWEKLLKKTVSCLKKLKMMVLSRKFCLFMPELQINPAAQFSCCCCFWDQDESVPHNNCQPICSPPSPNPTNATLLQPPPTHLPDDNNHIGYQSFTSVVVMSAVSTH